MDTQLTGGVCAEQLTPPLSDARVDAEARLHILAQFREFSLPFKI